MQVGRRRNRPARTLVFKPQGSAGTRNPTRPSPELLFFCLFQCFGETEYQTESKRNETFGNVIFSSDKIQETWNLRQESHEAVTRVEGAPPRVCPPASWARRSSTDVLPPPQLSVSTRSHLGACSAAPPEGASITEGFHIIIHAPPMKCE